MRGPAARAKCTSMLLTRRVVRCIGSIGRGAAAIAPQSTLSYIELGVSRGGSVNQRVNGMLLAAWLWPTRMCVMWKQPCCITRQVCGPDRNARCPGCWAGAPRQALDMPGSPHRPMPPRGGPALSPAPAGDARVAAAAAACLGACASGLAWALPSGLPPWDITVTEPSFSPPDVVWELATRSPCGILRWPHSVGGAECGRCKKPYGKRAPGARTTSSACSNGHRRHRRRCPSEHCGHSGT